MEELPKLFDMARSEKDDDVRLAKTFKAEYSRDVRVDFLGMWCVDI